MTRIFLALALTGLAAVPALAMDDMSCADFAAMDSDARMAAMAEMTPAMGDAAAGGMMATTEAMSPEDTMMAAETACTEHPDMMLGEAMQGMMAK